MKTLAQTFADIVFRPSEVGANDMILWRLFTDLLALMIEYHEQIFSSLRPKFVACGNHPD